MPMLSTKNCPLVKQGEAPWGISGRYRAHHVTTPPAAGVTPAVRGGHPLDTACNPRAGASWTPTDMRRGQDGPVLPVVWCRLTVDTRQREPWDAQSDRRSHSRSDRIQLVTIGLVCPA
ncbi:hypothetical protein RRG08_020235 [Elysia crispata]|uniref:Uncharacterized protein n=1 Tax=Elysia crispata TaxID=231223 RepID=A0AAE1A2H9_9GAST|nr:hypothetical protein RRG08_020235 [Elysia crispata]